MNRLGVKLRSPHCMQSDLLQVIDGQHFNGSRQELTSVEEWDDVSGRVNWRQWKSEMTSLKEWNDVSGGVRWCQWRSSWSDRGTVPFSQNDIAYKSIQWKRAYQLIDVTWWGGDPHMESKDLQPSCTCGIIQVNIESAIWNLVATINRLLPSGCLLLLPYPPVRLHNFLLPYMLWTLCYNVTLLLLLLLLGTINWNWIELNNNFLFF